METRPLDPDRLREEKFLKLSGKTGEEIEEIFKNVDIPYFRKIAKELYDKDMTGNYIEHTPSHENQSSDDSSLYLLIKYQGKDTLVKV
jgi:hypothetical protein